MRTINSPCTLKELYTWAMHNSIAAITQDNTPCRELATAVGWDDWQADVSKPDAGSIAALMFLFEKAAKGKNKKDWDQSLGVAMKLMNSHSHLMACIIVDFEGGYFKLDDSVDVKIVGDPATWRR